MDAIIGFCTKDVLRAASDAHWVQVYRASADFIVNTLPPDHRLWRLDNVIITPHIGGAGGGRERYRQLLLENIRRFIAGDALLSVVDPQRGC